jgi:hypothetical protein
VHLPHPLGSVVAQLVEQLRRTDEVRKQDRHDLAAHRRRVFRHFLTVSSEMDGRVTVD